MHKSFLDLVLESNQIEEMALKPEDFPDTYLKKAKDRQAIAREIAPLAKQFQEALVNLNWREITIIQSYLLQFWQFMLKQKVKLVEMAIHLLIII
jgi:hypothetical protein